MAAPGWCYDFVRAWPPGRQLHSTLQILSQDSPASLGLEVTPPANRPKVRVSTGRRTQDEHDARMDFHFKSGEITAL